MANPWVIVGVLVALIASAGTGYWRGGVAERNAIEAQQARDDKVRKEVEEAAQLGAAQAISKIEVKNVTVRQNIERETRIVPDYSQCHHSADGLQNVNAALTNSQPTGGGQLPGTDATR